MDCSFLRVEDMNTEKKAGGVKLGNLSTCFALDITLGPWT